MFNRSVIALSIAGIMGFSAQALSGDWGQGQNSQGAYESRQGSHQMEGQGDSGGFDQSQQHQHQGERMGGDRSANHQRDGQGEFQGQQRQSEQHQQGQHQQGQHQQQRDSEGQGHQHGGNVGHQESMSASEIDDAELEEFAGLQKAIYGVRNEYVEKIESASDEDEALSLQQQAQQEMISYIEASDLDFEQYQQIAEAFRHDEALQDRVQSMMN